MQKIISHIENDEGQQSYPTKIIVHAMGEYITDKHAVDFLSSLELSAHSLVDSYGYNYRCRKDSEVAWHAKGYNYNSLGIEFLVQGKHNYATFIKTIGTDYVKEVQYQAGLEQIKEWLNLWPIKKILRHSDVSPERKVDPGDGFPWERLLKEIGPL